MITTQTGKVCISHKNQWKTIMNTQHQHVTLRQNMEEKFRGKELKNGVGGREHMKRDRGMNDRDERSRGIEIHTTDVFTMIKPTSPLKLVKHEALRKRNWSDSSVTSLVKTDPSRGVSKKSKRTKSSYSRPVVSTVKGMKTIGSGRFSRGCDNTVFQSWPFPLESHLGQGHRLSVLCPYVDPEGENCCLLWIVKAMATDKNYIWISVWWKAKN